MKTLHQILLLIFLFINTMNKELSPLKEEIFYDIDESIPATEEYKTKEITFASTDTANYFKYDFSTNVPSSNITTFKLDLSPYSSDMRYEVYCTNAPSSTSDTDLKNQLDEIKNRKYKPSCMSIYRSLGKYDSIMKLDQTRTKIGIAIYMESSLDIEIKINLRITERILELGESKINFDESYSLVPITINVLEFRNNASKVLFYSSTRNLQMFEAVSDTNFPKSLFEGNILSIYTDPNQILRYHNATIMTLLAHPSDTNIEQFIFQVILLDSQFLLDYYVSSNSEGRPTNEPILINMTECTSPYYVIFNHYRDVRDITLTWEEIYGKMSYLGVATSLEHNTWEDMINNDIEQIYLDEKKYILPKSTSGVDIFQVECSHPLMLNFYYIDEQDLINKMKEGDIQIIYLKPYQTINVPFFTNIFIPKITIEIYNPIKNPLIIIRVYEDEIFMENTLLRYEPFSLSNGITIKERGGDSDTRVIIRVGYSNNNWVPLSEYIKYNSFYDIYSFEFSNYFYKYVDLTVLDANDEDNVEFVNPVAEEHIPNL